MSRRHIVNVPQERQRALADQFPWLMRVYVNEKPAHVQMLSVSVFDHWLTREEANQQLENVPAHEQARRDALLADFCARLVAATEVVSFSSRGRRERSAVFRRFVSTSAAARYCTPGGGRMLKHRHFRVVLPALHCALFESWDDTYPFYFTEPGIADAARTWAAQSGVYLLEGAA